VALVVSTLSAVTWWAWTLLWVVLVAGGGLVLYVAVRRLLRQGMALARELGAAADLLAEVTRTIEAAAPHATEAPRPAAAGRRHPSTRASSRRRPGRAQSQDVR
jgi:hypothetical protein